MLVVVDTTVGCKVIVADADLVVTLLGFLVVTLVVQMLWEYVDTVASASSGARSERR